MTEPKRGTEHFGPENPKHDPIPKDQWPEFVQREMENCAEDEKLVKQHEQNVEGLKRLKEILYNKNKPQS